MQENGELMSCGKNFNHQLGFEDMNDRCELSLILVNKNIIGLGIGEDSSFYLTSKKKK